MKKSEIYKRLYSDYSKKYLDKIILSALFSILVAASTSAIAWLLDPAIKKLFLEKDQSLIILIPLMIIIAFTTKGLSLYMAKATMISVGEDKNQDVDFLDFEGKGIERYKQLTNYIELDIDLGILGTRLGF